MKIFVLGRITLIQKIVASLDEAGIEVAIGAEEAGLETIWGHIDCYDLLVLDSLAEDTEAVYSHLDNLQHIPLVLVIKGKQADWGKLQSFDTQGYIYEGAGKEELAARLKAIMRRIKPSEQLKQVIVTSVVANQNVVRGSTVDK